VAVAAARVEREIYKTAALAAQAVVVKVQARTAHLQQEQQTEAVVVVVQIAQQQHQQAVQASLLSDMQTVSPT
jgi:hypothetical protein